MHEYESKLLSALVKAGGSAEMKKLEKLSGLGKDALLWAAETLAKSGYVKIAREKEEAIALSNEGKSYIDGFPEESLLAELGKAGKMQMSKISDRIGFIWAKKNGWVSITGNGELSLGVQGKAFLAKAGKVQYPLRKALEDAESGKMPPPAERETLLKRGLISIKEHNVVKSISITASGKKQLESAGEDGAGQLTREIIESGKWESMRFRPYDITAPAEKVTPARTHPVSEFMGLMRSILTGMGFKETSGPIVETAFWAFDALFSPQDHPTREMQDTFFLSNPKTIDIGDLALLSKVKKMHEDGWKEQWRKELAEQAILRQHTTSVSARAMQRFADLPDDNYPVKLFSIGKVFRNESIDYKHLAELYMCDGIMIGNNLNLANLMHTLKEFYAALGFEVNNPKSVRFKPSYFPFVEPGLEVNYFDTQKKDWIELCGAGVIRKEIVGALGGRRTVLAWGMGIDRLMFRELKLDSLMQLYTNEAGWLRRRAAIRGYEWQ